MIHQTRGIVFKTIKYSETSVVSKIYTEKFGLQSYLINGVRSEKSKIKAGLLQTMSILDMQVYYRENKNLNRVKEISAAYVLQSLPFDALKRSAGLFAMDVLNKCIREQESNEDLFQFTQNLLISLDQSHEVSPQFLLRFLIDLTIPLGIFPNGSFSEKTPVFDMMEGQFTYEVRRNDVIITNDEAFYFSELLQKKNPVISSGIRRSLLQQLIKYYALHIPNFSQPQSLSVLQEIFLS